MRTLAVDSVAAICIGIAAAAVHPEQPGSMVLTVTIVALWLLAMGEIRRSR